MANAIQSIAFGIIAVVIGIIILTSLGSTVVDNTATGVGTSLENASDTSKDMYSIIEIGYPMLGIMFMFGGGWSLISGFKSK